MQSTKEVYQNCQKKKKKKKIRVHVKTEELKWYPRRSTVCICYTVYDIWEVLMGVQQAVKEMYVMYQLVFHQPYRNYHIHYRIHKLHKIKIKEVL